MELRLGSCNERNQKEDIRMDDVRSLTQGKYPWGFIKSKQWNSKFVIPTSKWQSVFIIDL